MSIPKPFLKKKGRKERKKERKKIEEEDDSILYRALQKSLSGGWQRAKRQPFSSQTWKFCMRRLIFFPISFSPVYFR